MVLSNLVHDIAEFRSIVNELLFDHLFELVRIAQVLLVLGHVFTVSHRVGAQKFEPHVLIFFEVLDGCFIFSLECLVNFD